MTHGLQRKKKIILTKEYAKMQLNRAKWTIVDLDEIEKLSKYSWYFANAPTGGYAAMDIWKDKKVVKKQLGMHRFLMNCPKGMEVDHIDGNTLDNRKRNLRICTHAENIRNVRLAKNNTSGYKGVVCYYSKRLGLRYVAQIVFENKAHYLGTYNTAVDAALAYNYKAIELFGDFARTNELHYE